MSEPCFLSLGELSRLLAAGELTSVEATESALRRIEQVESRVGSFITVTADLALASARAADEKRRRGQAGPLTGTPIAIKDIMLTRGVRTTAASRILNNYVPVYNSTAVQRLFDAGAVMVGKTNMDEFAMGSSTENSAMGPVHNPWDLTRAPGGSSGGSAAAVAACEAVGALGTDTGGSIRQPAGFCGVVGLKPTYGRVSRYGVIAFASSLDQVGPFAADVRGCAMLLNCIAGRDPLDSTSSRRPVPDYTAALGREIRGLRVGVPREFFIAGIDPEVEAAVRRAIATLEGLGARLVEISLPHAEYALATYYLIATAEASSNLARYDGVQYGHRAAEDVGLIDMYRLSRQQGFGAEVKRRVMLGTYALASGYYDAYYLKAQKVRTLIKGDFDRAFEQCDVIAGPTSPTPAFRLGEKTADPLAMYLSDIFTIPVNLAAIPGLSLPCGFSAGGLPIGLQLLARHWNEEALFQLGSAFEQATDFHLRRPEL